MRTANPTESNVERAVPGFWVHNIEESVCFYVDGLGFKMTNQWVHEGKLRWCKLDLSGANHAVNRQALNEAESYPGPSSS